MNDSSFPTNDKKYNAAFHRFANVARSRFAMGALDANTIVALLYQLNREDLRDLATLLGTRKGRNKPGTINCIATHLIREYTNREPNTGTSLYFKIVPTVLD